MLQQTESHQPGLYESFNFTEEQKWHWKYFQQGHERFLLYALSSNRAVTKLPIINHLPWYFLCLTPPNNFLLLLQQKPEQNPPHDL